jgi:iron complex transport system substrate-binding protein
MIKSLLLACLAALALLGGPPRRVVSQTVGTDELLMALAEPAQVAALSHLARDPRFSPASEAARRFQVLRTGDAEDILRLRPDLVLVASYTLAETQVLLRRAKVPLLVLDRTETYGDLVRNTRALAQALGRAQRGEALVAEWDRRVASLRQRLGGVRPVRVLAAGLYPFAAGSDTTFQDLCDHAGALNVAAEAGLRGHAPMPTERALGWKIDFLVVPQEPGGDTVAQLRDLLPYRLMPALREGRVVQLPAALMSATGQARLDAYEALARALHPERFR